MRPPSADHPVELALERREPAGHAGRVLLVVPQVGRGDLLAEVGDVATHRVDVEHLLDRVHGRLELLDLCVEVWACHKDQGYGSAGARPTRQRSVTASAEIGSSAQTRLPPVSPASIPHDAASAPTRCRPRPCSSVVGQRLRLGRAGAAVLDLDPQRRRRWSMMPDPVRRLRVGEGVGGELAHHQLRVVERLLDPPLGELVAHEPAGDRDAAQLVGEVEHRLVRRRREPTDSSRSIR